MKNFFKFTLLIFIIFSFPNKKVYCCTKIAVVNIAKIFDVIPQKEKMTKKLEKELDADFLVIKKMKKLYLYKIKQLGNKNLSKQSRENLKKEIKHEKKILIKKIKFYTKKNRQKQENARDKILIFIHKLINTVAEKGHYNIIIDISSVAYIKNIKDITNDIINLAIQQNNILFI
ncbi:hypothetical protein GJT99_01090 [Enterobacteriaceae endosymbiont of Donacia cincticornis]|uniref:OmpH family outer membrane protein n=1 Tax=Enterobacteriaceae endosymbiont of Donacia cincticornis TaxID=2675773 RepID=UPI001449C6AE|nr:OmpH family outer membrane protein [Enterobacteriaceae endosymbiont of Donacia cincticornis]QJC36107.1 hypothetical protein GJT99_01090 [Enterobacteriaceae endosymbiont of Donacia cincticornis]